ncbi:hypothetical protein MKW98_028459 [Papaver atlanticum]|uniref:Uncharacterized protein n=1 Tax=Papaver atlanticum TaxID=357466 RepID=A0AAD4XWM3_9MAGN|nr:hypothetical protein MKW98_028459 [Papaver atlanticum]
MEGLKAMREEANHAASNNAGTSMPFIMNPNNSLGETSSVPHIPTSARRSDYCTNPMVPFSANKRTKNHMYQVPQNSFFPPITPPTQSYPPGPNNFYPSYQPHGAPNYWRGPVAPHRAFEPTPYHSPIYWRSPVGPPFHGNLGPQPQAWNRLGGTGGYCHPSNSTIGGYRGRGSGRGVGPRPGLNYPYHRRGSNYTFNNSPRPGTGRGSGRGRGSNACTSARERPEMFYNRSMMEDPWKLLKPVERNSVGFEDLLPKSITKKRPRTSEFTSNSCSE